MNCTDKWCATHIIPTTSCERQWTHIVHSFLDSGNFDSDSFSARHYSLVIQNIHTNSHMLTNDSIYQKGTLQMSTRPTWWAQRVILSDTNPSILPKFSRRPAAWASGVGTSFKLRVRIITSINNSLLDCWAGGPFIRLWPQLTQPRLGRARIWVQWASNLHHQYVFWVLVQGA